MDELDNNSNVIPVIGPSGANYEVLHPKEKEYWESAVVRYLSDFKFTNFSDLQDLDRIITQELISYRYQQWVQSENDYWGQSVDIEELNKNVRDMSKEIRLVKKSLGIDKSSRDKDKAESGAAYIENLRSRAHEFGIKRNEEAVKAISLWQELVALIQFHDNCTKEERKENHCETEDVLEWVRQATDEFNAIDEAFRKTSQKYWISDQ